MKLTVLKLLSTVYYAKIIRYVKGLEVDSRVGRPVKNR